MRWGSFPLPISEAYRLWYERLKRIEFGLIIIYAFVLPLPITLPWVVLIGGLSVGAALLLMEYRSRREPEGGSDRGSSASAPTVGPESSSARDQRRLLARLSWAVVIFLLLVGLGGIVNGGVIEAWKSIFSLRALIVYPWAFFAARRSPRVVPYAAAAVLLTGALAGCWGAAQQLFKIERTGFQYLQATGFLSAPMAYAGQMQILSLLSTGLLMKKGFASLPRPVSNKALFSLILLANWLGILFASERSGWLGVVVGLVAMSFLVSFKTAVKTVLAMMLAGGLAWATVPVVKTRLAPMLSGAADVSMNVRVKVWDESYRLFETAPVFGVGIRKFPHLHIPEASIPGYKDYLDHAHSNYLHLLATTGATGLFAYLALNFVILKMCWLSSKLSASALDRAVALGMFGATVSLLAAGLFEYNFGTGQIRLTYWFLVGLFACSFVAVNRKSSVS